MNNQEVTLLTKLIEAVDKKVDDKVSRVESKLDQVAAGVDSILLWRATIIGGALVASAVTGVLTQIALAWASK